MDTPDDGHDDDVPTPAPLSEHEEQLAAALRAALQPDRLDDERVQRLVDVAVLRAAHRRRQR